MNHILLQVLYVATSTEIFSLADQQQRIHINPNLTSLLLLEDM